MLHFSGFHKFVLYVNLETIYYANKRGLHVITECVRIDMNVSLKKSKNRVHLVKFCIFPH